MENKTIATNPAEDASKRALSSIFSCIDSGNSFLLEAGAGAGKTYSLIKTLQYLISTRQSTLTKYFQKIACITFTNVAKDEIISRIDRNKVVFCDTIHGFSWQIISGFQKQLKEQLRSYDKWNDFLTEQVDIESSSIEYSIGHRKISDHIINISHDDVIYFFSKLVENKKFQKILYEKFPIILVDEYQDTNSIWVDSIKTQIIGKPNSPLFGFFGDHWQKIYGDGCGSIDHPSLHVIDKEANFRSVKTIVDCLNRMRPELQQFVVDPNEKGLVQILYTNNWKGERQQGAQWKGDLPNEISHEVLLKIIEDLTHQGWDFSSSKTKILMLTHRVLAKELGYNSLPSIFRFNEQFVKKENAIISYCVDILEPACSAFMSRHYGEMFQYLNSRSPLFSSQKDKEFWFSSMNKLCELRKNGTVFDVIDFVRKTGIPVLPETIINVEEEIEKFDKDPLEIPIGITEIKQLHNIKYSEIIALSKYLNGTSPFETKHGVKGAEFENVLVVIGRGWNSYNFNEMLELAQNPNDLPSDRQEFYLRNRNLFYVVCSRPIKNLVLLFTQELSTNALKTLKYWFGEDTIKNVEFD